MREDMFKVIVERPRRGGRMRTRTGRIFRASEEVSSKLGMKQGYFDRKWLNENLSPLKRWLESQANRPWDKVYSELKRYGITNNNAGKSRRCCFRARICSPLSLWCHRR
jgi:hypothetical protein